MDLFPMLLSFIVACVVINICLTKKQMKIARAVFLAFGIIIGTCSLFLICVDIHLSQYWYLRETSLELNALATSLLRISALVYDIVAAVLVVATLILSVLAIKKIADYIKSHNRKTQRTPNENQKPIAEPIFACLRKIFVLHCRWNN